MSKGKKKRAEHRRLRPPAAGPRGAGAFAPVRTRGRVARRTDAAVAVVVTPCRSDERAQVAGLLPHRTPGRLAPRDRACVRDPRWREREARGVTPRARVVPSLVPRPIRVLANGADLAQVSPTDSDRATDRDGSTVRVLRSPRDDLRRSGHGAAPVRLTHRCVEHREPALAWIVPPPERGDAERTVAEATTDPDRRRVTPPAPRRSATPAGVVPAQQRAVAGPVRAPRPRFAAASAAGVDRDRWSLTGWVPVPRRRLAEGDGTTRERFATWHRGWLWERRRERTAPRRNRINPRVIKRKRSNGKKKRAAQRRRPPVKKTVPETVVILR